MIRVVSGQGSSPGSKPSCPCGMRAVRVGGQGSGSCPPGMVRIGSGSGPAPGEIEGLLRMLSSSSGPVCPCCKRPMPMGAGSRPAIAPMGRVGSQSLPVVHPRGSSCPITTSGGISSNSMNNMIARLVNQRGCGGSSIGGPKITRVNNPGSPT